MDILLRALSTIILNKWGFVLMDGQISTQIRELLENSKSSGILKLNFKPNKNMLIDLTKLLYYSTNIEKGRSTIEITFSDDNLNLIL